MVCGAKHHDDGALFGTGDVDGHAETVDGDGGGRHLATLQAVTMERVVFAPS